MGQPRKPRRLLNHLSAPGRPKRRKTGEGIFNPDPRKIMFHFVRRKRGGNNHSIPQNPRNSQRYRWKVALEKTKTRLAQGCPSCIVRAKTWSNIKNSLSRLCIMRLMHSNLVTLSSDSVETTASCSLRQGAGRSGRVTCSPHKTTPHIEIGNKAYAPAKISHLRWLFDFEPYYETDDDCEG